MEEFFFLNSHPFEYGYVLGCDKAFILAMRDATKFDAEPIKLKN